MCVTLIHYGQPKLYTCTFKMWEAKEGAAMMLICLTVIVNQASCNWLLNMMSLLIL